jgi:hypothetical protein
MQRDARKREGAVIELVVNKQASDLTVSCFLSLQNSDLSELSVSHGNVLECATFGQVTIALLVVHAVSS